MTFKKESDARKMIDVIERHQLDKTKVFKRKINSFKPEWVSELILHNTRHLLLILHYIYVIAVSPRFFLFLI